MKKILCLILVFAGLLISFSLTAQAKNTWKEMDDFHSVMSGTFHPAEEGDLKPIKAQSQEMIDKAIAWQKSNAPEGYNKKAVKGTLKKLVKESKALHGMIKSGAADKELVAKLNGLHDIFHEIMENCSDEEQEQH